MSTPGGMQQCPRARGAVHNQEVIDLTDTYSPPRAGLWKSVSDCVEMYQNGQDENVAFFWHHICCGSRRGDSHPLAIARDTKKTDKKATFLSGSHRNRS